MKSIIDDIPALKALQGTRTTPFFSVVGSILGFSLVGMVVLVLAARDYSLPDWTNTVIAVFFGLAMLSTILLGFRYLGQQAGRNGKPQGIAGAIRKLTLYLFLPAFIICGILALAMYIHYLQTGTPYFTELTRL